MIQLTRTIRVVLLVLSGLLIQHCGSNDPAPPQTEAQRVASLMKTGTWKIQTATVDGVNQNALFVGLKLSFTDTGFTSTNGAPVWPANGTWIFTNAEATSFTRNDGVVVTIQDISSASMTLLLNWSKTTLGPGRVASVSGQTVFVFGL